MTNNEQRKPRHQAMQCALIIASGILLLTTTGCSSRAREKRIKWTEVPQKVQDSRIATAPEIGRILMPFSADVTPRPEMDNDPREPILVPSKPIILADDGNGRTIQILPSPPVSQAEDRLFPRQPSRQRR